VYVYVYDCMYIYHGAQVITFKLYDLWGRFVACWFILTLSKLFLLVKVQGHRRNFLFLAKSDVLKSGKAGML